MPSAIAPGSISASRSDAKPSAKPHTMTRGVLATAQAVYAPEQGMWVYSIRLSLLAEGMPGALSADERGFETCQLRGRHWLITDASGREDRRRISNFNLVLY